MAGRKPTPAALTKLRGNPSKRGRRTEPEIDNSVPTPPEHLDQIAVAEWDRITSLMSNAGMMSPVYRALLASYCQTYSDWVQLSEQVQNRERWRESDKGYPFEDPMWLRVGALRKEMDKQTEKIGITPVMLSKVHVIGKPQPKPTKEQALAEKLFKVPVKK